MAQRVVCVVGPTASGKTKMGVALAKRFNGEVVSVDSMQIYRGMEIGTAAPTPEEMAGVPHHMIGVADPAESWSVSRFTQEADRCIQDILRRGKLPVLVGGTGLYLDALVRGQTFAAGQQGGAVRLALQQRLAREGAAALLEEEWSFIRHYTYNPAWRKGKEAFFATDGSDQIMIVMFAPEGCVINGVDSELYDWEEKLPRIEDLTDGMPPALQKLMGSREVKKMKSTFCVWTEDGTTWHCNPMDSEDASKDLLSTIDGNPLSYVEYGKWFYPADLPLEAVRQLADGVPVTKELVIALNPKRNEWEEIKAGLDKIGYPHEL